MLIEILIDDFNYDGFKYKKGSIVETDEGTGLRLIKFGYGTYATKNIKEKKIVTEVLERPMKRAIIKSTNKNV